MNKKNTEKRVGNTYVTVFDASTKRSVCKSGMNCLRDLGDTLIQEFGETADAQRLAVIAWKEYVVLAQKWYALVTKGEPEIYAEKIKKVEPTYQMPKKAGCISIANKR